MKSSATGVFTASGPAMALAFSDLGTVRRAAGHTERRRARVCMHSGPRDAVQEMIIVLKKDSYVRPHRHEDKSESFHVVAGEADVVLFDDSGAIYEVVRLGTVDSGHAFFFRMNASRFHTLVVRSPAFIVHETTSGPFSRNRTIDASWAPPQDDPAAKAYMRALRRELGRMQD